MRDSKGRFVKGSSGNPNGKSPGTRHKATLLAIDMLEGESEALVRKIIDLALGGDTAALKMCLERIVPVLRQRPVACFDQPVANSMSEISTAICGLMESLSKGEILPSEADVFCKLLEQQRRQFEFVELEERLASIEEKLIEKA